MTIATESHPTRVCHTWRFWCVIAILSAALALASVEATIVGTALPTIVRQNGGGDLTGAVWVANSYLCACTMVQPTFAQISDTFGRLYPLLFALSSFTIGSATSGAAKGIAMLIAGRVIQGLGAGGIKVLSSIIISDLVPLRERGRYYAIIMSTGALASTLGPVFGGALADADWRWIFFLNVPPAGVAMIAIPFCLRHQTQGRWTWQQALARVDWIGSAIFIPSILAVLYALVIGGVGFPWGSYHVVVPLVLGLVGWGTFHTYQASRFCQQHTMPPKIFQHRTAVAGYAMAFILYFNITLLAYFMPIYFQAAHAASPTQSGVYLLPSSIGSTVFAVAAGILLSRIGQYKQLHWAGFALQTIGYGAISTLKQESTPAMYCGLQLLAASGVGLVIPTILPAILAALPVQDITAANGVFCFIREFAGIWGITIPSVLLNWGFDHGKDHIHDQVARDGILKGNVYAFSSSEFISSLPLDTREEVIGVYVDALCCIWWLAMGMSFLGFCLVFMERRLELRKDGDTEYRLEDNSTQARS